MKILKCLPLLLLFIACNKNKDGKLERTAAFEAAKINAFFTKYPQLSPVKKDVEAYYQSQNHKYIWFDDAKLSPSSVTLHSYIKNITADGLPNTTVYANEFDQLISSKSKSKLNLDTELMLTSQFFVYAKNVWYGISAEESKSINWKLPRKKLDFNNLLDLLASGSPILQNPPVYRLYVQLREQLKIYKGIKAKGGLPAIDASILRTKVGDSSVAIGRLRQWLTLCQDLKVAQPSNLYDADLDNAIKICNTRFGLDNGSKITAPLIKEMNISVEQRILEIKLNMERSRWIQIENATDYLLVNIPEFKMHVYEKDKLMWSSNVVVGKTENKTVIFADKLETVVFSPYWNVPQGILKKEILPGIAKNANYLEEHNMEWFNGNIRQKPGPENSLGLVKFLFPNSYDIYLHDTPSKSLFDLDNRAFSHGCVRIESAEKLANYLLKGHKEWNATKINEAMHSSEEKHVKIKKKENVFIVYFTAWVDNNGRLNFRKDVYNRDGNLKRVLAENDEVAIR